MQIRPEGNSVVGGTHGLSCLRAPCFLEGYAPKLWRASLLLVRACDTASSTVDTGDSGRTGQEGTRGGGASRFTDGLAITLQAGTFQGSSVLLPHAELPRSPWQEQQKLSSLCLTNLCNL